MFAGHAGHQQWLLDGHVRGCGWRFGIFKDRLVAPHGLVALQQDVVCSGDDTRVMIVMAQLPSGLRHVDTCRLQSLQQYHCYTW
jgi:hypothetical protein